MPFPSQTAVLLSVALGVAGFDFLAGFPTPPLPPVEEYGVVELDTGAVPVTKIAEQTVTSQGTTWSGLPAYFDGGNAALLADVSDGDSLVLSCSHNELSCMFIVALLKCSPCSVDTNGGLPGPLLDAGFDSASCKVKVEVGGVVYGSTYFRKTIGYTEPLTIPLQGKSLRNAAVFTKTVYFGTCEGLDTNSCNLSSHCEWDKTEAKCGSLLLCPHMPKGPFLPQDCTCPPPV
ncbi:hypothetical protein DIPPA_13971 [Diplonema papillatum]|nr:hypothetical protein DIPPA_13971 [Diplonema papillatum]